MHNPSFLGSCNVTIEKFYKIHKDGEEVGVKLKCYHLNDCDIVNIFLKVWVYVQNKHIFITLCCTLCLVVKMSTCQTKIVSVTCYTLAFLHVNISIGILLYLFPFYPQWENLPSDRNHLQQWPTTFNVYVQVQCFCKLWKISGHTVQLAKMDFSQFGISCFLLIAYLNE